MEEEILVKAFAVFLILMGIRIILEGRRMLAGENSGDGGSGTHTVG
jgi:hypothetical protein